MFSEVTKLISTSQLVNAVCETTISSYASGVLSKPDKVRVTTSDSSQRDDTAVRVK